MRQGEDDDYFYHRPAPTLDHPLVYEPEDGVPTGILDATGRMIYNYPDPIGYILFDEEHDDADNNTDE